MKKLQYWNRIFKAYILGRTSQLTFWHGEPKINQNIAIDSIGPYYMSFQKKAEYNGNLDKNGIPMLDYQGVIGLQYNPISIAQWGLGNYNIWKELDSKIHYHKFIKCANWLVENLEENNYGLKVWMHHFDWEYRDLLKSPWYSGLAQGQGLSVLVRAHKETKEKKYKIASNEAIKVFFERTDKGGVNFKDSKGYNWIEEYIVHPPTHILNGFIWGIWGIYDYSIYFNNKQSMTLFDGYKKTMIDNIKTFDTGYWSLYEHSGTLIKMISSPFYHKLHIVQLKIMYQITGENIFNIISKKWSSYEKKYFFKNLAFYQKVIFKIFYY